MRAVDLPELRHELRRWTTLYAAEYLELVAADGELPDPTIGPRVANSEIAQAYADFEVTKLTMAELYFVRTDMTQLALGAARSLPDFRLDATDLPAPYGFMYFEAPIRKQDTLPYMAASWGPASALHPQLTGVGVTWYRDMTQMRTDPARAVGMRLPVCWGDAMLMPFVAPGQELVVKYLGDDDDAFAATIDEGTYPPKHATLLSSWLLMQQRLTVNTPVDLDRFTRKRLGRLGESDPTVRIVTLRHASGTGDGTTDREYRHQWIVNGHWRQQWYPSEDRHKPIWIAPHIKGPEGAPLLGGEKVYAWTR